MCAFLKNGLLEFARVVKAHEQVVAGTLHHLTIEAVDAGKKKLYEAKIWVRPWMNSKELQEFKHAGDVPAFTSSDLGARIGGHCPGWQEVPVHDPEVQDAADHAVKTIQQRSNSLFPYELHEIVHAKAEVSKRWNFTLSYTEVRWQKIELTFFCYLRSHWCQLNVSCCEVFGVQSDVGLSLFVSFVSIC